MRISGLLKTDNTSVILEAARFGNKQLQMVTKFSKLFKIGVEYEFIVDEGESAVTTAIGKMVSSDKTDIFKWASEKAEHIIAITEADAEEVIQAARLLDVDDEEDVQAFFEYYYGDLLRIARASNEIHSSIPSLDDKLRRALDGLGFPMTRANTIRMAELPAEGEIDPDAPEEFFGSKVTMKRIIQGIGAVLDHVYRNYVKKECWRVIKETPNELQYINMVNDGIKRYQDDMSIERTKIDVVEDSLPVARSLIEGIVMDITVPDGVEVVTKPLPLDTTVNVMKQIFGYIPTVGSTTNSTGVHVNISLDSFSPTNFNAVKAIVLLDPDAHQYRWPERGDYTKSVNNIIESQDVLLELADIYKNSGPASLISAFEKLILANATKLRSVNLTNFLSDGVSQKHRRIEYRFPGGAGYENRFGEIVNDMFFMCYVMLAGSSKMLQKEYLRGIIRVLDRAVRKTFATESHFSDLL